MASCATEPRNDQIELFEESFRCSENDILPRHVSSGVLLSERGSMCNGLEGPLQDLKCNRVESAETQDTMPIDCGQHATLGSVYFMALQLVKSLDNRIPIQHEVRHDLESFIWVLSYAVARRFLNKNSDVDVKTKEIIADYVNDAWGGSSLRHLIFAKACRDPIDPPPLVQPLIPSPILSLFHSLNILLGRQEVASLSRQPPVLDHAALLDALGQCVGEFESPPSRD